MPRYEVVGVDESTGRMTQRQSWAVRKPVSTVMWGVICAIILIAIAQFGLMLCIGVSMVAAAR